MSILGSSCHALSAYANGIWISEKNPKEINDKITTTKTLLKPLIYDNLPLIIYKNENIYSLLLTPVKKLHYFNKTNWNSKENCTYCDTCKTERSDSKMNW